MMLSDCLMSDVRLSRTSGLSRKQREAYIGRPKLARSPRHTWLGHHFHFYDWLIDWLIDWGQRSRSPLLTAALTREAGAAVTVRTYWAWETTATLRLLGGTRGVHGWGEGGRISCRHTHSLLPLGPKSSRNRASLVIIVRIWRMECWFET